MALPLLDRLAELKAPASAFLEIAGALVTALVSYPGAGVAPVGRAELALIGEFLGAQGGQGAGAFARQLNLLIAGLGLAAAHCRSQEEDLGVPLLPWKA